LHELVLSGSGNYFRGYGHDVNLRQIHEARQEHGDLPNASFEVGDIRELTRRERYDVVTAARVLQWLALPLEAVCQIVIVANPGFGTRK
jgi:trans-aconitate methyltransferase